MKSVSLLCWTVVTVSFVSPVRGESDLDRIKRTITAMHNAVEAPVIKRTDEYVSDLAALEKKIAPEGNLDFVLQIKNERESWEKRSATPAIDPKDNSVSLDLRKLRYFFDQDLAKLEKANSTRKIRLWNQVIDDFNELEARLTRAGRIDEALVVRKTREDFVAGQLSVSPPQSDSRELAEKKESFSRWLSKVRFIVPSGHAFRIKAGSVYLRPPGGEENWIADADIDKSEQIVSWVIGGGLQRAITVSSTRRKATLSADREEDLEIEEIE